MGSFGHWAVVLAILAAIYGIIGFGGFAGETASGAVRVFWLTALMTSAVIIGRIIKRS